MAEVQYEVQNYLHTNMYVIMIVQGVPKVLLIVFYECSAPHIRTYVFPTKNFREVYDLVFIKICDLGAFSTPFKCVKMSAILTNLLCHKVNFCSYHS